MPLVIVTGSSGLVGSECVRHFDALGWSVVGIDNNFRKELFGDDGDTRKTLAHLLATTQRFKSFKLDIRDRAAMAGVMRKRPDLILHCAGQPSHDLAAKRPFDDFDVNAVGTLNLLEAARLHAPDAVFCFASTNKVYGDTPNRTPLIEGATRWTFADEEFAGFNEFTPIDQCQHSLFGASKLAADVMVQEYARAFGLKTGVFRFGCLTGSAHAAAEQHGFLAYLVRCVQEGRPYRVYGYEGKQVRDNLHARDVARAFELFAEKPMPGEVFNLGGGMRNSVSILEAIQWIETLTGKTLNWEYVDQPRAGDHICYVSDNTKFNTYYPTWAPTPLDDVMAELCGAPTPNVA